MVASSFVVIVTPQEQATENRGCEREHQVIEALSESTCMLDSIFKLVLSLLPLTMRAVKMGALTAR